jgi:hypothetical protein
VVERMTQKDGEGKFSPVVIVKRTRESWGKPEWLIPLAILLAGVIAANVIGFWPFQSRSTVTVSPADIERGRQQLLQIDALRIRSVVEETGQLPESLDEIQPGLDSVLLYEPLEDGRFRLDLLGVENAGEEKGTIYDAVTGKEEEPENETP